MLESSCSEIPLGDTPPEAFSIILEYMYSGKVGKVDLQVCIMYTCTVFHLGGYSYNNLSYKRCMVKVWGL